MTWEEGSKCHKLSQAVTVCTEFAHEGACQQSDMTRTEVRGFFLNYI